MNTHQLSECDIGTKIITPAVVQAGWQPHQFRQEASLTGGHVTVRGNIAFRVRNPPPST